MYIVYYDARDKALTTKVRGLLSFHNQESVEIELEYGQVKDPNINYFILDEVDVFGVLPQVYYRHLHLPFFTKRIGGIDELKEHLNSV